MAVPEIQFCPGTLNPGFDTYSPVFRKRMFDGRKVAHILPFSKASDTEYKLQMAENRSRISISGFQEKYTMVLDRNKLRFAKKDETGRYILKPIPGELKNWEQLPANEHLSMQIARQVYGLSTAENGLVFLPMANQPILLNDLISRKMGAKKGLKILLRSAEKVGRPMAQILNMREVMNPLQN